MRLRRAHRLFVLHAAAGLTGLLILPCAVPAPAADVIRVGLETEPISLDPRQASDAVSSRLCRLLYERLTDLDENYRVIPSLADWVQLSPTHYRFSLRDAGRTFHDGSRLTADDVRTTYQSVLNPGSTSPHRGSLTVIQRITAPDEDQVEFFLNRPDPMFPGRLAIGIMPSTLTAVDHVAKPVGSGPFRFVRRDRQGRVTLERLSDRQPIQFLPVRDNVNRVLKLARGELDILPGSVPRDLLPWLQQHAELVNESGAGNVFTYIGLNMRDPGLADDRVRQAIAHAIDRQALIRFMLHGQAAVAASPMPPDHWVVEADLPPYRYDPERARELLRRAGYGPDKPLHLSYKTSNNPFRVRLATVIRHQLEQVGISTDLRSYDWGTFYGDIRSGRFQIYTLSWVGVQQPDFFRYAYHSDSVPPHGANRGFYEDELTDDLIDQAEREADETRSTVLYRRLQRRLHETLPYIPLWYESQMLVRRRDIVGYRLSPDGRWDSLSAVHRAAPAQRAVAGSGR